MDLVLVIDKKLLKQLAQIPAKDWFINRQQIQRDHPRKLEVASWEWVPAQTAGPISVKINRGIVAAFIFANYASPGDHRARVDTRKPAAVLLAENDLTVRQLQ